MRSYRLFAIMLIVGAFMGMLVTVIYLQSQTGLTAQPTLAAGPSAQVKVANPATAEPAAAPAVVQSAPVAQMYDEDVVVGVYERVSPAVVNITINRAQTTGQLEEEIPLGTGSGFIVDRAGYIVTNNHVVEGADTLDVTFAEGTTVSGTVLGRDPASDLALMKVEIPQSLLDSGQVRVATLGDSDSLRPGQMAIAIGNPFGFERTITVGVISGLNREIPSDLMTRPIRGGIQTDAAINPGNSGGPLLNAAGEVVGVNSSIESPVRGSVGVGFAVPINTVKRNLEDLVAGREIRHPRVGIMGYPVTQRLADQLDLPVSKGVYVVQVTAGGPADAAGLRGAVPQGRQVPQDPPAGGDVIVAIDGQQVSKIAHIAEYIEMKKRVGETVTLTVKRGNEDVTLQVALDAWPAS